MKLRVVSITFGHIWNMIFCIFCPKEEFFSLMTLFAETLEIAMTFSNVMTSR